MPPPAQSMRGLADVVLLADPWAALRAGGMVAASKSGLAAAGAGLPLSPPCLQLRLSGAEGQLAEAQAERDQLRQQLARVSRCQRLAWGAGRARSRKPELTVFLGVGILCIAFCLLQATSELNGQLQASGQHRQHVAAVQQAEREARAALQHQQASAAQHSQQVGRRKDCIAAVGPWRGFAPAASALHVPAALPECPLLSPFPPPAGPGPAGACGGPGGAGSSAGKRTAGGAAAGGGSRRQAGQSGQVGWACSQLQWH